MRVLLIITVAALIAAGGASSASSVTGFADGTDLGNAIETHGIVYNGKRKAVDSAYCSGLRRYGVRKVDYFDQFHRFKCTASAADQHFYEVQVTILRSSNGRFTWQATSVRKQF